MTTSAEWESPVKTQFASPVGWVDEKGYPVATKEHIDQLGISVAPNGSLVVRYINGDGQRVTLDLSAYIEFRVENGIQEHMRTYHGHQI